MAEPQRQYFESFDRLQLRGVGPLDRPPDGRPHVAVTVGRDQVILDVYSGSEGFGFHIVYRRCGEGFVADEIDHFPDEPLPWKRRVLYVVGGVEHGYTYFYGDDPETTEARPVLAEYTEATPGRRRAWTFPLFVDAGEASTRVQEFLSNRQGEPLPARVRDKATTRSDIVDRVESGYLVRTEVQHQLGSDSEGEPPVVLRRRFDLRRYPASFVDYFGAWMEVDDPDD